MPADRPSTSLVSCVRALDGVAILDVWDEARLAHPVDRALAMLASGLPELSRDELAALPVGRRDMLLLALRAATFGDRLPALTACPVCGLALEFEASCDELRLRATASASAEHTEPGEVEVRIEVDGCVAHARLPNSFDEAAIADCGSVEAARGALLARCVISAERHGEALPADAVAPEVGEAIARALAASDPGAELLVDLHCPGCSHQWESLLDVTRFFWIELASRARRLLLEVHALARAYGWTEAEILALAPARRAAYLQMVTA